MNRIAKQSRPQTVYVLADNSTSMGGEKARAATEGVQEMLMECQSRGPSGKDRSYFRFTYIEFDELATLIHNDVPVRHIDPDTISLMGNGGMTNITRCLELVLSDLRRKKMEIESHPERAEHPIPLVMLFSDGCHNDGPQPEPVAHQIKSLPIDDTPINIVVASVDIGKDRPDEVLLSELASDGHYISIQNVEALTNFISSVGSSGASSPEEIRRIIENL